MYRYIVAAVLALLVFSTPAAALQSHEGYLVLSCSNSEGSFNVTVDVAANKVFHNDVLAEQWEVKIDSILYGLTINGNAFVVVIATATGEYVVGVFNPAGEQIAQFGGVCVAI